MFILAIVTPPNNFDSDSYHLHRILAWIQNRNLDFFPTSFIQQLYLNVFAEYLVLNVYLVSGTDYLVNLVQFFSGLGCVTGISLLAAHFGMNTRGQIMASLVLLTLPFGIFEMTTTQVEYVASLYFLIFLYFGYRLKDSFSWKSLIAMSVALGFAIFSKYPAAFYALPFCIYFGLAYLKNHKLKRSALILITASLGICMIFAPFSSRNYSLFGDILSPKLSSRFFEEKLSADAYSVSFTLSNLLKNSSLHFGLPHAGYNNVLEKRILQAHALLGVDINEPKITRDEFSVRYSVHEDTVPNSLHFFMICLFTLILFIGKASRQIKIFWILALCGFVLFCTMLKFQLWSTRTHLPFFAMGSLLIGFILNTFPRKTGNLVLGILFVPALLYVYGNPSKSVAPISYWGKAAMAHIPTAICLNENDDGEYYRNRLAEVYDFNTDPGGCFVLKKIPGRAERRQIFKILDSLGYYAPIRKTIFSTPREQLYFVNNRDKYARFEPLMEEIEGENPSIGFINTVGEGFYFYHAALVESKSKDVAIRYIYTKKDFEKLPNAHREFCYEYVLTDDLDLAFRLLPRDKIDRVIEGKNLSLLQLKEKSCVQYYF